MAEKTDRQIRLKIMQALVRVHNLAVQNRTIDYPLETEQTIALFTAREQARVNRIRLDLLALLRDASDLRVLERGLVEYVEALKGELKQGS